MISLPLALWWPLSAVSGIARIVIEATEDRVADAQCEHVEQGPGPGRALDCAIAR